MERLYQIKSSLYGEAENTCLQYVSWILGQCFQQMEESARSQKKEEASHVNGSHAR